MSELKHRELARRLAVKAIRRYSEKFMLEQDLLSGIDRQKILDEIEDIARAVSIDDRRRLLAERDYYKKQVEELEARLNRVCSLDDCDEEFEL